MAVLRRAALLISLAGALLAADPKLAKKYDTWLNQEVVYIITSDERKEFLKLPGDAERDRFMQDFWDIRNPQRGSQQNPYKEEHYKRVEYANQTFGRRSNTPGWKTDMGRTYILFGKPASRAPFTGYGQIYPLELWFYDNRTSSPSLPSFYYVLFFIPEDIGEYRFYHPIMDGPMKLVRGSQFHSNSDVYAFLKPLGGDVANAPFSLNPSEPVDTTNYKANMSGEMLVNKILTFADDSFNARRIRELRSLRSKVDSWLLLPDNRPIDINMMVLPDPAGQYWLDYSVTIDDASLGKRDGKNLSVSTAFRLLTESGDLITEDAEQRVYPAFDDDSNFQPFEIANRLPLVPGTLKLEVQITNRDAGRTYRAERKITIAPSQLSISSLMLASSVQVARQADPNTPFQYFGAQFQPAPGHRFTRRDPLRVLFQVQAPSSEYQAEYVVANTQNREMRRTLTDTISAAEFRNGRLLKAKSIPLTDLENGEYRIVVNLRGPAGVLASSTLPLRIEDATPEPHLFFLSNVQNVAIRGVAAYIRGLEALSQPDQKAASMYFGRSLDQNPANTYAAAALIQMYFNGRNYLPIVDLYKRMGISPFKTAPETLAQISLSFWQTGDRNSATDVLAAANELFPSDPLLAGVATLEKK